jgi:hypothetical protein
MTSASCRSTWSSSISCGSDVGDRGGLLDGVACKPAQRRAFEASGLGLADRHADSERIAQIDAWQPGGGRPNEIQVAGRERPLSAVR